MTLTGAGQARRQVYVGESDNLRRRLAGNYRDPGGGQQTSLRINRLLRDHLAAGGAVTVAIATAAGLELGGRPETLDLARKAGRLLAENAAMVAQQIRDDADIVNLGWRPVSRATKSGSAASQIDEERSRMHIG